MLVSSRWCRMASSVSLDFAKNFLGVTSTTDDLRIQACVDAGSQSVNQYCKRRFTQQTYTHFFDGSLTQNLCLKQSPVLATSASDITVYLDPTGRWGTNPDGSFQTATLLVYGTDYAPRIDGTLGDENDDSQDATPVSKCGILYRIGRMWPGRYQYGPGLVGQLAPGAGNIQVTYTAGWTQATLPMSIRIAICQIAGVILRSAPFGGFLQSESWQGYSYSLGIQAINGYPELGTSRANLNPYRRAFG